MTYNLGWKESNLVTFNIPNSQAHDYFFYRRTRLSNSTLMACCMVNFLKKCWKDLGLYLVLLTLNSLAFAFILFLNITWSGQKYKIL
jgi:hypothetical protein